MHQMWLGGGFGRRLDADMMVPAVQAAKAVGKPVKVIYCARRRHDHGLSRPLTYQKVKAGLDGDGKLIAHAITTWSAPGRPRAGAFRISCRPRSTRRAPRRVHRERRGLLLLRAQSQGPRHPRTRWRTTRRPSGQLRSVAPGWTFWAVESMIDELAHGSRQGSGEFRHRACWTAKGAERRSAPSACATRCSRRWARPATARSSSPQERGHGRRLRLVAGAGNRQLDGLRGPCRGVSRRAARSRCKKLTVAIDVGTQVHPDNIRAQVEGATLWGLSLAMYEKATLKDGGIEQTNFDTYTPLRMSQVPEVAVSVIANGEQADRRRRAGGDGGRASARQRHLQRLRRARPLAADHGGSGQGGHEGLAIQNGSGALCAGAYHPSFDGAPSARRYFLVCCISDIHKGGDRR